MDVAAAIPGSKLHLVEGMGHVLLPALRSQYVRWIMENIRAGEEAAARKVTDSEGSQRHEDSASSRDLLHKTGENALSEAKESYTKTNSKL
ncbi:unnamed protein product [Phytomonas sp. EM1]|nr:unnamed protein product [Phytomonas sp. EM1]|eukprot:CCW65685.1 unnamed protein product [Phytomonas sp. isolate EM1]